MLLTRLDVLCAILGLGQFGVGVFVLIAFLSQSIVDRDVGKIVDYAEKALSPNLWYVDIYVVICFYILSFYLHSK